ncbi:FAD-dependent oxidoreductase [Nesterenkonia muleiensis]|uniref:FAD-dependent oxidoreductase n=1 Tax=Nesterenkonia muleiensis TaxID=2282648 RepID=UPI000E752C17|nr:NAD(P)/FAD-dependent oxidoreductase [Nesterenkonia muleiensis]
MPEVIVIGAGPVGLLMAAELCRHGIGVEILEQREQASPGSRAIGIHAPVLAALESSGLTAQLLERGLAVRRGEARSQGQTLGTVRFDRLPARFPFVTTLPQAATEQVFAQAAPPPRRGVEVTAVQPSEDQVLLHTSAGVRRAPLVVLAGGARSRRLVYRDSEAHTYPDRYLMTDAVVGEREDSDTAVVHLDSSGVLESFPLPEQRRRFVAWDPPGASADPEQQQARMEHALVTRGETVPVRATGFGVRRFLAPRMRRAGLFVIGDAAHEVSPIGGQGMNLGLLDAATLAPLLADWLSCGTAPEAKLQYWESSRLRSARRASALGGLNTRLGRPAPAPLNAARRTGLRLMLGPGTGTVFARAYAMGFDLDA